MNGYENRWKSLKNRHVSRLYHDSKIMIDVTYSRITILFTFEEEEKEEEK